MSPYGGLQLSTFSLPTHRSLASRFAETDGPRLQMATLERGLLRTSVVAVARWLVPQVLLSAAWMLFYHAGELHGFAVAAMDAAFSHPGVSWLVGGCSCFLARCQLQVLSQLCFRSSLV